MRRAENPIAERDGVVIITPVHAEICAEPREGLEEIRGALNDVAGKQPKALVVNLSNVDYVDSIGLGAIVAGKLKLPDDCDFHICSLRNKLDSFIRITGLSKFIHLDEDLESALRAMKNQPPPPQTDSPPQKTS